MMFNVQPCHDAASPNSALVRALNSIKAQQTATIVQAVHAASPDGWITTVQDDYDGFRSILIEPRQPYFQQPCYFVSGTAQCLELFEAGEEHLTLIGSFDDVESLSAQMLGLLAAP